MMQFFLIFLTTGQISITQIKFIFGGAMKDVFERSGKQIYLKLIFYLRELNLNVHGAEKYFELLLLCNEMNEKQCVCSRHRFKLYRHKKVLAKGKTIRG